MKSGCIYWRLLCFLTRRGPFGVVLIARSLKNGFSGAWPLALGVAIGDVVCPVLALITLGQLVGGAFGRADCS